VGARAGCATVRRGQHGPHRRRARDRRRAHGREQRVAAGLAADPLAIIVSASLDLPPDLPLLQDPDSHVAIITGSEKSLKRCRARVEYLRTNDLPAAVARLRSDHGVRAILCEGGPRLNASLLADRLIDELFLTTVPLLADGAGALTIIGDGAAAQPIASRLLWLLEHEGELFARYAVGT